MDDLNQFIDEQLADPEFARRYVFNLESQIELLHRSRAEATALFSAIDAIHQPDPETGLCLECAQSDGATTNGYTEGPCDTYRLLHASTMTGAERYFALRLSEAEYRKTYEQAARSIILNVLTQRDDEYGDEGDAWLGYWTPDWAYLKTNELANAICEALEARRER